MRRILFYIFLIFTLWCAPALAGHGVVAVYSGEKLEPKDKALSGFQKVCKEDLSILYIKGMTIAEIREELKRRNPALIFVIGTAGLKITMGISNIPIVYVMVLRPENILTGEANITGVSLHIDEKEVYKILAHFSPGEKKCVGMLYSERTVQTANSARDIAREADEFEFFARRVGNANALPNLLRPMRCRVKFFWLLLDYSVAHPEKLKKIFPLCRRKNVAVLTYNYTHHERGAVLTIEEDDYHNGTRAGAMAVKILRGAPVATIPPEYPQKYKVRVHMNEANRLGIELTEEMLERAEPYFEEIR